MPKNKKAKKPPPPSSSQPSSHPSSSDGDDDSEDEGLNLHEVEGTPTTMQVEFGFFDPKPTDYHGVRALLARSSLRGH